MGGLRVPLERGCQTSGEPHGLLACESMRQHSLRLSDELMQAIDSKRGQVPRNAWLVTAIEARLKVGDGPVIIKPVPHDSGRTTPAPKAERSPGLSEQIKSSEPEAYGGPMRPGPLSKPPLQRPIVQKRGT